jgi:hypothetical protein
MRASFRVRSAMAAAALALLTVPASAGIIVTEGDVAQGGDRVFAMNADCPPTNPRSGESAVPGGAVGQVAQVGASTDSRATTTTKSKSATKPAGATTARTAAAATPGTDLDAPPAHGWTCTTLPGGMQYCEPVGTGAAEGAAGGGWASADEATAAEVLEAGCSQSRGADTLLATLAALALVATSLRRRRAPSYGA